MGVEPSDQIRGNFGRKGGVVNWQSLKLNGLIAKEKS